MKSVLFDFGGTLDSDGTTWLDRFYPIYKEKGITASQKAFNQAFYRADDTLPERFPLKGLSFRETLDRQVDLVLEALAPERRSLRVEIAERFLEDCREHFKRNKPVLERLRRRYRLGIVSNFYGNLEGVLASEGLMSLFDTVADSGVVGTLKPDAGIFLHALSALGSSPADCVMVGDSIPRDMRGAEGLRMAHAKVGRDVDRRCCADGWSVSTLPELEPLLA